MRTAIDNPEPSMTASESSSMSTTAIRSNVIGGVGFNMRMSPSTTLTCLKTARSAKPTVSKSAINALVTKRRPIGRFHKRAMKDSDFKVR